MTEFTPPESLAPQELASPEVLSKLSNQLTAMTDGLPDQRYPQQGIVRAGTFTLEDGTSGLVTRHPDQTPRVQLLTPIINPATMEIDTILLDAQPNELPPGSWDKNVFVRASRPNHLYEDVVGGIVEAGSDKYEPGKPTHTAGKLSNGLTETILDRVSTVDLSTIKPVSPSTGPPITPAQMP